MRYLYALSLLAALSFGSSGCDGKKEEIPAYLRIDSVRFSGAVGQGTNSQNITEAWVLVDDDIQGIYDLPFEVPVLAAGRHNVKILAGIKRNGMLNSRVEHPLMSQFSIDVDFQPLKVTTIDPVVHYVDNVDIWEENFEDAGVKFLTDSGSDTTFIQTANPAEVFEGSGSGKFILTSNKGVLRVKSNKNFQFPVGFPVFMEINYKSNDVLLAGLVIHQTGGDIYKPVTYINSSPDKWGKMYINLSEAVSSSSFATGFDLYLESRRVKTSGSSSPETITILVDNVKTVHSK